MNIVEFPKKEQNQEPNETAIKLLEALLENAKSGKLKSLAVLGIAQDSPFYTFSSFNTKDVPNLLGTSKLLESELIDLYHMALDDIEDYE